MLIWSELWLQTALQVNCTKAIALFGLWIYPAFYLTTLLPVAILRVAHGLDSVIFEY